MTYWEILPTWSRRLSEDQTIAVRFRVSPSNGWVLVRVQPKIYSCHDNFVSKLNSRAAQFYDLEDEEDESPAFQVGH